MAGTGCRRREEVQHAVMPGAPPGHQGDPGGRRERRHHGVELCAHATVDHALEDRHDALIHQRIEDVEGRAVDTDQHDRIPAHRWTPSMVHGAPRWAKVKETISSTVISGTSCWTRSARYSAKGRCRWECSSIAAARATASMDSKPRSANSLVSCVISSS